MKGIITQVIGPVGDVRFEGEDMPEILSALEVAREDGVLTLEVAQHTGSDVVRAIAMSATDGLKRGMAVVATGQPISVPVGPKTLGRMFNVTGDPIDGKGRLERSVVIRFIVMRRALRIRRHMMRYLSLGLRLLI